LRRAATGLEGATPTPLGRGRQAAPARPRRPQIFRAQRPAPKAPIKAAPSNPDGRRGGVRAQLCVSRRRAFRPDRVCHAESEKRRGPWRLRSSPSENAHQISRSAERHRRQTSAIVTRMGRDAQRLGAAQAA